MSQTRVRWTVRDLEVLPQNEGTRYELIDGELFVTLSPHRKHQQVAGKIYAALDAWSEVSGLGVAIPAPGIIPSDTDNVIPDVVWVSHDRLALIEDEAGHLTGFPELVVEVLSPGEANIRRDREAKLKLYSVQGCRSIGLAIAFLGDWRCIGGRWFSWGGWRRCWRGMRSPHRSGLDLRCWQIACL